MIKYTKIDIKLKPNDLKVLPFIGSTLRGAFGVALKKVVCINPSYSCEGCFAQKSCIYYDFYEEKNKIHKFRFDFLLNQKVYDFSLYLFEDATDKLPYILSSLHKMLTELGLGVERKKFEIDAISVNDKIVYQNGDFKLSNITPLEFKSSFFKKDDISLFILTPLRIKYQNKLLNQTPPLEILISSIYNKVRELKSLPRAKLDFTPKYTLKSSNIRFLDQTRRSNRQKTKLKIGGIVGELTFSDIDEKSLYYLELGEILGVGKQTSFGMGKIKLT